MNRRDRIKDLYSVASQPEKLAAANFETLPVARVPARPVQTMGLALDRMESETQALREALAAGISIVEIEPDRIEASFVRDRLSEIDSSFETFRQSIATSGQEVPILVRPHPEKIDRFQIAFGHRRHRACASLAIKVKAIVRPLSDRELVIAQGVENAQRKDLSYVERALYAARLEDRGFDRAIICEALATEKGELSKLISVARDVPEEIIAAIGPAPKAGRRRWMSLAGAVTTADGRASALHAIKDPDLERADSDTRFLRVLAATTKLALKAPRKTAWLSNGKSSATIQRTGKAVTLAFEPHVEPEFAEYVVGRLDELYAIFRRQE